MEDGPEYVRVYIETKLYAVNKWKHDGFLNDIKLVDSLN